MVKILYHANCLDGFGAAFAAWKHFGDDATYTPVNYDQPPPDDLAGHEAYILDFSYPRDVLEALHEQCAALTVIDHHKTAQEALAGLDYAQFDMSHSGAYLAWRHFHPNIPVPELLLNIEDRDLWKFLIPTTKEVAAAIYGCIPFQFDAWDEVLTVPYSLVEKGAALLKAHNNEVQTLLKYAHPISLKGVSGLACNVPSKYSSDVGHELAVKSGSFGLTYYYGGQGLWFCSLRSNGDKDISWIAKSFGGGGHKNAAGFSVKNLGDLC